MFLKGSVLFRIEIGVGFVTWSLARKPHLLDLVERRKRDGRVRDCHGDLHLDNMILIDNQVVPFDCI